MLNYLKTYLLFGNLFCGVEYTSKANQDILYACVLKKSKNVLNIENTFKRDSVEILATKLSKKQHVFLIVNNNNVLTKCYTGKFTSTENLAHKSFPNIKLDDFYYDIVSQKENHFVSICRKVYVDELINKFEKQGIAVINIALGNLITSALTNYTNYSTLQTSNANVSIKAQHITQIEKAEHHETASYNINGLKVKSDYVLSLSAALNTLLTSFQSNSNLNLFRDTLKGHFKQSRFFNLFLKTSSIFILSILLFNFFVFNYYYNQVNTLQQTSQINHTTKQRLLNLNETVSKSQKMVDDMLKSHSSKCSFYTNIIIQGLPNSILLSDLNYQPLKKNIKKDKTISLKNNIIILSGISNQSHLFSKYVTYLESLKWVTKVEILSYKDSSKSTSNFTLKLNMIHENQD